MATDRKFGVEIEHGNLNGYTWVGEKLVKKFPKWDNTGSDGSGVEVRSPILQGQSGYDELGEVMEYLVEIGGYVSRSDGMHVHHDISDFHTDVDAIHRVLESYHLNHHVIDSIVDPHRKQWQVIQKQELQRWKREKLAQTGRHAVHYVPRYGTLEFRQFEGCLDAAKALAWIEFGQKFIDSAVYGHVHPIACANAPDVLFRRIGCRASAVKLLSQRGRETALLSYNEAAEAARTKAPVH